MKPVFNSAYEMLKIASHLSIDVTGGLLQFLAVVLVVQVEASAHLLHTKWTSLLFIRYTGRFGAGHVGISSVSGQGHVVSSFTLLFKHRDHFFFVSLWGSTSKKKKKPLLIFDITHKPVINSYWHQDEKVNPDFKIPAPPGDILTFPCQLWDIILPGGPGSAKKKKKAVSRCVCKWHYRFRVKHLKYLQYYIHIALKQELWATCKICSFSMHF